MREERCVCTFFFFFFFLNFGLTRPFRPIQADTDRVGPILAASAPISAESAPTSAASARVGPIRALPRGTTRSDAAGTRGLRRPRVPPRRTRVRRPQRRVRASQLFFKKNNTQKNKFIFYFIVIVALTTFIVLLICNTFVIK